MNRKAQFATRASGTSDVLSMDVLKSIVGGAGADRKDDLTAERATALTAGPADATNSTTAANSASTAKLTLAEIEKSLRGESGAMKPAAHATMDYYKLTKTLVGEGSGDAATIVKKGPWENGSDKHKTAIEKADQAHGKAQGDTRAAAETLAAEKSAADRGAKLWAQVEAVKADLKKAQDRPAAGGKAADTVQWHEERLAKAMAAVKDVPSEAEAKDRVKAADEAHAKAKTAETEAKDKADTLAGRTAEVKAALAGQAEARDAVKAIEADLKKAKERPGAKAETVKWHEERLAKAKAVEAKANAKAEDLATRSLKAAEKTALKQQDRDNLKDLAKKQGYGKTISFLGDAFQEMAKEDAKARGTHSLNTDNKLHAGGVSSTSETTVRDGKIVTETVSKVAQVKETTVTENYSGPTGKGASASWGTRAEAGVEKTVRTVDPKTGHETSTTQKAYAGAGVEAKAGFQVSAAKIAADAAITVSAHAEASISKAVKMGNVEVAGKIGASADAEAGAKAGASLGFDGVKLSASASASVTAKAGVEGEVKIGGVAVKNELEVYATAKAEAKAAAEVNFNPFSGEKVGAKVALGAEAAAGVGIQDTLSVNKNLQVGAGVYAGKIGAKADVDVGVKDGKLKVDVDVGAAVGVGFSVKFKVQADFKNTAKKAANDIKNGNIIEKATGVLSFVPPVFFIRSLFG